MAVDESALEGHWVHSHEEDTDAEMVFRPASQEFPRSRGRESLELRPDGSYVRRAPGPVDVPAETTGRWRLAGDRLELADDVWELGTVAPDRLTVRK